MTGIVERLQRIIEALRFDGRQASLADGFPFWGYTDPLIGDLNASDRPVRGHTMRRHGPGDWRCTCGTKLSGGLYGSGRTGARDVMRSHRLNLNHTEHVPMRRLRPYSDADARRYRSASSRKCGPGRR
jgi:hypothetical protein